MQREGLNVFVTNIYYFIAKALKIDFICIFQRDFIDQSEKRSCLYCSGKTGNDISNRLFGQRDSRETSICGSPCSRTVNIAESGVGSIAASIKISRSANL